MKVRSVAVVGSILVAVGMTAVAITEAGAALRPEAETPAVNATAGVSPQILAAMQRDLGLTADQARARLVREDSAAGTEARLRKELGTTFAGAWLTGNADTLVVGITNADQAAAVRSAGAQPVVVTRNEAQLDAVKSTLDGAAAKATGQIAGWYVDGASNSVVVTGKTAAAAKAFVSASGADTAAIRTVVSGESPQLFYDVRGGDAYFINNQWRCSIGFSVVGGFVTAGHCGTPGNTTAGHNNVSQGTVQGSSFPSNDYGWVRVNSNWTPTGVVNNYAGGTVAVAGSQEAAVGASICRSGSTTGWRCGTIQAKNQTVNYSQGAVFGLTRTNACAEGGDSGGSWLSGNQAQGVTSGGSGNCTSGGTTFFQPVNEILSVYGLTLVTSGGGGGGGGSITGIGGKCVDVNAAGTANGTKIQLWTCNGTGAQQWSRNGSTVRALGKCMDVAGGGTAGGTLVQLWDCNGSGAQNWQLRADGTLQNPQSGRCLDAAGWGTADGTQLIIWDCHGGANQVWRFN